MNLLIRKMTLADVHQVHDLGSKVEEFRPVSESTNCFWPKETLEAIAEKEIAYVAEKDGQIVGFLIATYQESTRKLTWENMYVRPEYRGGAIAHQCWVLAEQEARARGATYLCGMIEESNALSFKMLEREGFTKGKIHVWMEKSLLEF